MKNINDIKILVLEGGFNEEHDVSIETATQVKKSLSNLSIKFDSILVNPSTFVKEIKNFDREYLCFNALHGPFGEDGSIQKILDNLGFKYTHTNSKSSYIGFNKQLTKAEIKDKPILTPDYLTIHYKDISKKILIDFFIRFGAFIIKPTSSGSSYGIKIFRNENDIKNFIKNMKDK